MVIEQYFVLGTTTVVLIFEVINDTVERFACTWLHTYDPRGVSTHLISSNCSIILTVCNQNDHSAITWTGETIIEIAAHKWIRALNGFPLIPSLALILKVIYQGIKIRCDKNITSFKVQGFVCNDNPTTK